MLEPAGSRCCRMGRVTVSDMADAGAASLDPAPDSLHQCVPPPTPPTPHILSQAVLDCFTLLAGVGYLKYEVATCESSGRYI